MKLLKNYCRIAAAFVCFFICNRAAAQHTEEAKTTFHQADSTEVLAEASVPTRDNSGLLRTVRRVRSSNATHAKSESQSATAASVLPEHTIYIAPHFRPDPVAPHAGGTVIVSNISAEEEVHVHVTDMCGRTLLYRRFDCGHDVLRYEVSFDERNMQNGMYNVRIVKGGSVHLHRFVISN